MARRDERLITGRLGRNEGLSRDRQRVGQPISAPRSLLAVKERPRGQVDVRLCFLENLIDQADLELAAARQVADELRQLQDQAGPEWA